MAPVIRALLTTTFVSFVLLFISVIYYLYFIIPNAKHIVFQARRPTFVGYIIIMISVNMVVRSIVAILLYKSLISIIMYREIFRFVAIFGEILCLILRMYTICYDFKLRAFKQNNVLCKYLQRGNDTKQALKSMTNKHNNHYQCRSSGSCQSIPSQSNHNRANRSRTFSGVRNRNKVFDESIAKLKFSFMQKILHKSEYFGDLKIISAVLCLFLLLALYIPGLFLCTFMGSMQNGPSLCYIYQIEVTIAFAIVTAIILFIFVIYYNFQNGIYCKRMRLGHLNSTYNDDVNINLEMSSILVIIFVISSVLFIVASLYEYDDYNALDQGFIAVTPSSDISFTFILMYIWLMTVAGVMINCILMFVPYFSLKKMNQKYELGKLQSKQFIIELDDLLCDYSGFHAFLEQLIQEYSAENLMFLVEFWQYKFMKSKTSQKMKNGQNKRGIGELNQTTPNHNKLEIKAVQDSNSNTNTNSNALNSMNFQIQSMIIPIATTNNLRALSQIDPEGEESDDDGSLVEMPCYSQGIDLNDIADLNMDNAPSVSVSRQSHTIQIYETESIARQCEIDNGIQILTELPWYQLPLSDSFRKYQHRYEKAVHIFNKYMAATAFEALNISETAQSEIENAMRQLYEYKLRSYNIGIELDENEKRLELNSTHSNSRNTNFDFYVEPNDVNVKEKEPEILVTSNDESEQEKQETVKIKRKRKLRQRLGLEIHFTNSAPNHSFVGSAIQSDAEFEHKLFTVFDICLPDILNNLQDSLDRFRSTNKSYYLILANKF